MKNWQLVIISYNVMMRYQLSIALILTPTIVFASPAEERPDTRIPILETAQEIFGTRANFVANRLDSFFATERADDEFGRSRIRVRSIYQIRERAAAEMDTTYRVNLKLPHLEQKFRYEFLKKEEDEKKKSDKKDLKPSEEKKKFGELEESWTFNSDIGVSVAIPPKLVTRARARKNFKTGTFIHRFAEQLTYITDESGLVEETTFDSDHIFNERLIFRFINNKRWRVLQKDFTTAHGPTLLHQLTDDDAFNYSLIASSVVDNGVWYFDNYRLALNYRRNLYRQWVYMDLIPGIDFPKIWSFRRTPFISMQIELLFGR